MPHLVVEYSHGLEERADIAQVCRAAYAAILETDVFPTAGIRIRAHRADFAIVADGHPGNDFLAMTMSVGAGRPVEVLRQEGDRVFAAVRSVLAEVLATPHFALSLEIRVIDSQLSWKDTPIHARLAGTKQGS